MCRFWAISNTFCLYILIYFMQQCSWCQGSSSYTTYQKFHIFLSKITENQNNWKWYLSWPSSNIVHLIGICKNLHVQIFKPFQTLFACINSHIFFIYFIFWSGGVQQTGKNFIFCWFWLGKTHWNGLSGAYSGFEACQIQWCRFWVSTISKGSWKIKISGKNFTFCWFWLGKKHWNGLSGAYLGLKACRIQWHRFWVSMISSSWKIKIWGDKYHEMALKIIKMEWDLCSSAWLGSHSTPTPHFRIMHSCQNYRKPE